MTGDAALLGKNTGMDAEQQKLTWVKFRGVEGTRRDAEKEISLAIGAIRELPWDTAFFAELAQSMATRKQ